LEFRVSIEPDKYAGLQTGKAAGRGTEMIEWLSSEAVWFPVVIFLARILDVSIGTMRMIAVTRGQRAQAVGLAFLEVLIWIKVIAAVFQSLDQTANLLAYAAGFATGNLVGMWLESKLALGIQMVTLVSRLPAELLAEALRLSGVTVTMLAGAGSDGPVSVCMAVVGRRRIPNVLRIVRDLDPNILTTITDVRQGAHATTGLPAPGKHPFRMRFGRTA
jgi:uncharacterized protein YebE (UPF0316 family)